MRTCDSHRGCAKVLDSFMERCEGHVGGVKECGELSVYWGVNVSVQLLFPLSNADSRNAKEIQGMVNTLGFLGNS